MVVRKRLNFEGPGLFFVTTTVTDWLPIFEDEGLALMLLQQFQEISLYFDASIVGYVVIPSHFHALVGLKSTPKLAEYMQSFKSLSSRKVKAICSRRLLRDLIPGGRFALWKRGFDDLLIHSQKQFRTKLEYIHNNPAKAGLVSEAAKYTFSSASEWLSEGSGVVKINRSFSWT